MDCNRKFLHFLEFSQKSSCSFCGLRFGTVLNGVFCLFEHRLGENPVASGGVIDQNMGHSTHEAPILEDGASAHALHDAAGHRQKRRVGHPDDQIPARVGVADPLDLDAVSAGRFPSMVAHISAGPVTTSCANAISRSWPEKWVRVVP